MADKSGWFGRAIKSATSAGVGAAIAASLSQVIGDIPAAAVGGAARSLTRDVLDDEKKQMKIADGWESVRGRV